MEDVQRVDSVNIDEVGKLRLEGLREENSPRPTDMNSFKNAIMERRKSEKPESLRKSPERKIDAGKLSDDIFSSKQKDAYQSPDRVRDHSKTRQPFKIYAETTDEEKSMQR